MKCQTLSKKGSPCRANAINSSNFCFTHDPTKKMDHIIATQKGGEKRTQSNFIALEPLDLTDAKTILYLIADTINRVRKVHADGTMDVKVANCVGFLAGKMLDAQSQILIEERISKLEGSLIENGIIK